MAEKPRHNDLGNDKMKQNIFEVPEGYFEHLHDKIMSKVDSNTKTSPLDSDHLKENVFTVPEGYFESLPHAIAERVNPNPETKVIPLFQRSWVRYAAAAVILLTVFVLGIKSDDGTVTPELSDEAIIAYLVDEEISGLDIFASVDDGMTVLQDFIDDELGSFGITEFENPELEYDFEYIEY